MRRNLKICSLCEIDVPAVGKYFLPRKAGCESGWFAVCKWCAVGLEQYYEIQYYDGRQKETIGDPDCGHDFQKQNLVTREDFTDLLVCEKCGMERIRRGLGG